MKTIFIVLTSIFLNSCERNYGYILDDENGKPLKNVLVTDLDDSTNYVVTNEKGEFKFSKCGDLIISKLNYKNDTLEKFGCKPGPKCFDGHSFYMEKINKLTKKDTNIQAMEK